MAVTDIIAHRFERPSPTAQAELALREKAWVLDGRVEECFRELKQCVLKKSGKDYGRFSGDRATFPFASWLEELLAEKISFTSFSRKAMQHLKLELEKTEVPVGAFLVFAREKLEGAELLHIFMVEHGSGQYIDGDILLADSLFLDTAGVKLAAKINLTDLQCDEPYRVANAIAFLRWRGEKELTDVFEAFVGFTDKVDLGAETELFLDLVSGYTKTLPEDLAEQTKTHVVDYCLEQDKQGKPVVIADLSTQISVPTDDSPVASERGGGDSSEDQVQLSREKHATEFAKFVMQNQPEAKPELIPDTAKLRQYVRISGRNDSLSMSFASACLGETIIYDQETDSLTIKNIPSALKSRLIKHMQKSG